MTDGARDQHRQLRSFGGGAAAKAAAFLLSQGRTGATVDGAGRAARGATSTTGPNVGSAGRRRPQRLQHPAHPGVRRQRAQQRGLRPGQLGARLPAPAAVRRRASSAAPSRPRRLATRRCDAAASPTRERRHHRARRADAPGPEVQARRSPRRSPRPLDWLTTQQAANGSFNSGNANSTGLAGWALGVSGRTAAAAKAAGVAARPAARQRGHLHQVRRQETTVRSPWTPSAWPTPTRAARRGRQRRRRPAPPTQALPALLWAPGGAAAGDTKLTGPPASCRPARAQSVTVSGAPGNTLCVTSTGTADPRRRSTPAARRRCR